MMSAQAPPLAAHRRREAKAAAKEPAAPARLAELADAAAAAAQVRRAACQRAGQQVQCC